MKFGRSRRGDNARTGIGQCPRCGMEGAKLVASIVLQAEVCTHCMVAGAAGMGWLRESDVHLLPGNGSGSGRDVA